MNRKLNVKVLLIVLLVVGITGAGLYFLQQYQVKSQVKFFLQKADEAEATKDLANARQYLERYILMTPNDRKNMDRYAILVDSTANNYAEKTRAYLTLEKAIRQYVASDNTADARQVPDELHFRAAKRAIELQRFKDAEEHLEKHLLRLTNEPLEKQLQKMESQQVPYWESLAKVKFGLRDPDLAIKVCEGIIEKDRANIDAFKEIARYYLERKEQGKLNQVLSKMVQYNPDSAEVRLIHSTYLREMGRNQEASQELAIAQQKPVDEKSQAQILLSSAELLMADNSTDQKVRKKNQEDALALINKGIQQFPTDVRFLILKAQLEFQDGKKGREAALSTIKLAIPLVGENLKHQWYVAKLLLDAGDQTEAVKLVDSLRNKFGKTPVIEYLQSRILKNDGKPGEAVSILERIKDGLSNEPKLAIESDFFLASLYQQLGNPERQLAAYERIIRQDASIREAQLGKADCLAALGKNKEAEAIYQRFVKDFPVARLGYVRQLIIMESRKPADQRKWTSIENELEQCSAEVKATRDYRLLQFQLLANMGKISELESAVDNAISSQPKEVIYWLTKMNLARRKAGQEAESQSRAIEAVLSEAEKAVGDAVELRLARAATALSKSRADALSILGRCESNTDAFSMPQKVTLLSGLADFYISMGLYKDAKRLLETCNKLDPLHLASLERLIEIANLEKNEDEAKRLLKSMREVEGEEGFRWKLSSLNRMFEKLQNGDRSQLVDTDDLVKKLNSSRPGWFKTAYVQGRLLELTGQIDQAIDQYKLAVELGERNPEIIKRTVQLLTARRRPNEARQILAQAMSQSSGTSAFSKLEAELTLSEADSKQMEKVLAQARQAIRSDSKDYRDHLWLGNVHWAAQDRKGAEESFRKAIALAQDEPDAWATWLVYLVRMDRKPEAAQELKRAEALLKEKANYALVPYYESLEEFDKAESYFVKLVESRPNDAPLFQSLIGFYFRQGQMVKAETLLKKYIESAKVDATTLAWARRTYALTLAAKGDYAQYKEALDLVEGNLKTNSISPEDLRTRALIKATRPGSRKEIIKDLESSFTNLKPKPNEAILLAHLYEDEGDWNKANSILNEMLKENEGKAPQYLAYYIMALIRNNDVKKASELMTQLEEKSTKPSELLEAKTRLLFAQSKNREAVEYLEKEVERIYGEKKDASVYMSAAGLLEQVKEPQAAEKMIKRYVTEGSRKNDNAILAQVAYWARQGRITDAISLCEEYWNKLPVGNVAMACVAALNTGKATKEQMGRVEQKLTATLNSGKSDIGVLLALADLHSLQNQPAHAEKLYRKVLEINPKNPVALNNLAWHLREKPDAFDEAMQLIDKAIEQAGPDGALLDTRGMILCINNKQREALKDISEAVDKSPTATHLLHMAFIQDKSGNRFEAERYWKKVLASKLDPETLSVSDRKLYQEISKQFQSIKP
ncbi:MAG: tetratricopeptide repeat protein [Planctomycetia bacterium]|nr:tetratricopeptide repeat protein [Planctomycetia bacterium]